jgi:hypothetical protein
MAARIDTMMRNPQQAHAFGEQAARHAAGHFSLTRQIHDYLAYFAEIQAEANARP